MQQRLRQHAGLLGRRAWGRLGCQRRRVRACVHAGTSSSSSTGSRGSCGNHRGGRRCRSTCLAALWTDLCLLGCQCIACRCHHLSHLHLLLLLLHGGAHHAHLWRQLQGAACPGRRLPLAMLPLLRHLPSCRTAAGRGAVQPLLGVQPFQRRQALLPGCRVVALLARPHNVAGQLQLPLRKALQAEGCSVRDACWANPPCEACGRWVQPLIENSADGCVRLWQTKQPALDWRGLKS